MQKIFSIYRLETNIILPPDDAGHFLLPVSLPLFLHMSPHLEWCVSKFWNELEAKGRFQILLNIFGFKGDCWKTSHELGGFLHRLFYEPDPKLQQIFRKREFWLVVGTSPPPPCGTLDRFLTSVFLIMLEGWVYLANSAIVEILL